MQVYEYGISADEWFLEGMNVQSLLNRLVRSRFLSKGLLRIIERRQQKSHNTATHEGGIMANHSIESEAISHLLTIYEFTLAFTAMKVR